MKSLNDVNKGNDVKNQPVEEMNTKPEKIDFSKVKVDYLRNLLILRPSASPISVPLRSRTALLFRRARSCCSSRWTTEPAQIAPF